MKTSIATTITVAICVLIALSLIIAGITKISDSYESNKNDYPDSYYDDPGYIRDTYESCCSTAKHKQAIYSYDLNNDNSISAYEMDLFLKAHPNAVNDKQFMAWLESQVG